MAAELTVPRVLEALAPEGFRAAHDVRTAYGTLDHVVAGPNGVFAIETKNVRGVLSVRGGHLTLNGNSAAAFVTQAAKEASEIGRRLHRAGMGRLVPALVVSTTARVASGPGGYKPSKMGSALTGDTPAFDASASIERNMSRRRMRVTGASGWSFRIV